MAAGKLGVREGRAIVEALRGAAVAFAATGIADDDDAPTAWESLTEQQHRSIIENGGRLPEGVSAEMLRRG